MIYLQLKTRRTVAYSSDKVNWLGWFYTTDNASPASPFSWRKVTPLGELEWSNWIFSVVATVSNSFFFFFRLLQVSIDGELFGESLGVPRGVLLKPLLRSLVLKLGEFLSKAIENWLPILALWHLGLSSSNCRLRFNDSSESISQYVATFPLP